MPLANSIVSAVRQGVVCLEERLPFKDLLFFLSAVLGGVSPLLEGVVEFVVGPRRPSGVEVDPVAGGANPD